VQHVGHHLGVPLGVEHVEYVVLLTRPGPVSFGQEHLEDPPFPQHLRLERIEGSDDVHGLGAEDAGGEAKQGKEDQPKPMGCFFHGNRWDG
jgi:hypothetical protein